jgi:hypothetical protein
MTRWRQGAHKSWLWALAVVMIGRDVFRRVDRKPRDFTGAALDQDGRRL